MENHCYFYKISSYFKYIDACFSNDTTTIEHLIKEKCINIEYALLSGESGLHIAASRNYKKLAELLIKNQIDINKKDLYGKTALMRAVMYGNFEIVNILLTQPTIDINETDIYGNTASILGTYNNNYYFKLYKNTNKKI